MPVRTSSVSPQLSAVIERAVRWHAFVVTTIPDQIVLDTDAKQVVAGLFSLVVEHHGAILYLLRTNQFDGSAFALARPLLEAVYNAHWIASCAKPETVARIRAGEDCYPGFKNVIGLIDAKLQTGNLFSQLQSALDALHGFTHGGIEQLAQRFDHGGNVTPTYTDEEKMELANSTTAYFTTLAIAYCQAVTSEPDKANKQASAIADGFGDTFANQAPNPN